MGQESETSKWQDRVRAALLARQGEMTKEELLDLVSGAAAERTVRRFVRHEGLAFETGSTLFTPAPWFFRGGRLLIRPKSWEIEAGVLVPGHRFLPMYAPALFPVDISLWDKQGKALSRRPISRQIRELVEFFSLFGIQYLTEMLAAEDEANVRISPDEGDRAVARVSAFDMAVFYSESNFQEGDWLDCRLQHWGQGEFDCRRLAKEDMSTQRQRDWTTRMAGGFHRAFQQLGARTDPQEQIAHAYFFAGRTAVTKPGASLGELVSNPDIPVYIVPAGSGKTALWESHEPPETDEFTEEEIRDAASRVPEGVTGGLNEILEDIGLMISAEEIEAFMRDALYRGRDLESALSRCLPGVPLSFAHAEQETVFYAQLQERWKHVLHAYDAVTDKQFGPLRARIIDQYASYLDWIRGLDARDVDPTSIPREPAEQLSSFFGMLGQLLEALNGASDTGAEKGEQEELAGLYEQLESIEETAQALLEDAEAALNAATDSGASSEPLESEFAPIQDGATPQWVYDLNITLNDIKPNIRRTVRVPGSYTLFDLHEIIQIVMPWDDYHLHAFKIGKRHFAPVLDVDEPLEGAEDDDEVTLDMLDLQKNQRFTYTYDFGDDWRHTIRVSKVHDPGDLEDEEVITPRCLSGQRAAPPEDCGGPPGYERIVHIVTSDESELDAEDEIYLEWANEWDPEEFDLEAVNEELRNSM